MNTDVETSQIMHDSKEKNDIYKNMQNLQRKMDDIKNKNNKDYLVVNQYGSPEEIINRSYAYIKSSQKELDLPETHSLYNLDYQNLYDSNGFSKLKRSNISNLEKTVEDTRFPQKNNLCKTSQHFYNNRNEVTRDKNLISSVPITERFKQFNQNLSQLNSYNDSLVIDNMMSPKTFDQNIPKEELENVYLTNKILNKSNMELKAKIKDLENEIEAGKQLKIKLQEMNKLIENLNKNISNYEFKIKECGEIVENLHKQNNELNSEIKRYKSELEGVNDNYEFMDKTNYELKLQIDNLEEINTKSDNDKDHLNQHLKEKDKIISELNEKIKCLNDVNSNTKKSCRDYEDMLNGMKKTIEIMKKSGDDYDSEMKRIKVQLVDLQCSLEKKTEEYTDCDKLRMSLQNELELLKNEIVFVTNERNNKEKIISENNVSIRNLQGEIDKLKLKVESLNKIVEEKDKTIENMKNSVLVLNRNLEECKSEYDNLKKQLNDEVIEKSKLSRSKEQFDFTINEYKKQIDELTKLKDNLYKQNFALEEDNSVFRSKFYSMRNENENLNMKINYLNEAIAELNNEINNLNNKINDSEHEKMNLNLNINELMNKISQFSTVEFSLKNDIDNLNLRIENKEKIIENLIKSKEEINQDLFQAKDKIKSIINEKTKLIEEVDYKVNEIKFIENKTKRDNEKYSNELKSKDNYIENLQKSLVDFKSKMNELSSQRERDFLTNEKVLEEVKRENEDCKERVKRSLIEKEECLNELKYKNKIILNLENNIAELNENLCASKKNYDKLHNLYREHLEIIDELREKNEELSKKTNNFSTNLEKVNEMSTDIKIKNQDLLNKYNILQIENSNLKIANEKLETENRKLDVENKRLSQIENLKSIIVNNSSLTNFSPKNNLQKTVKFENPLSESMYISRTRNKDIIAQEDKSLIGRNEHNVSKENLYENSSNKKDQIYVSLDKVKNCSSEINIKTSEVNYQLEKKKNSKVDILEGSKIIFSIFDNKRILRFDLENRVFKLIEFADFGNFDNVFNPQGSIYLNILEGLLIVTGDNHDQFYHYSHTKHTMNKLTKLNNNHSYGSMIYYDEGNSVVCLSGWHNKRVEKYVNDEIIFSFLKKPKNYLRKTDKQLKNTWSQLPELTVERSEASYAVLDKYIYGFFGFNCPQMKYLDTIERLNIDNPLMWEMIEFKQDKSLISAYKKSHACVILNDNELLFIGGYDGLNDCPIEYFSFFNVKKSEYYSTERKLPEISKNHIYNFQKNNSCVPYIDIHNRLHLVAVDEKDVVHVVDAKTLQYDLFVSFD